MLHIEWNFVGLEQDGIHSNLGLIRVLFKLFNEDVYVTPKGKKTTANYCGCSTKTVHLKNHCLTFANIQLYVPDLFDGTATSIMCLSGVFAAQQHRTFSSEMYGHWKKTGHECPPWQMEQRNFRKHYKRKRGNKRDRARDTTEV